MWKDRNVRARTLRYKVVALPIGQARHRPLPFRGPIPVDGAANLNPLLGYSGEDCRRLGFFHSSGRKVSRGVTLCQ